MGNTFNLTLKAQNIHSASTVLGAVTQLIPDSIRSASALQSAVFEVTGTSANNTMAIGAAGIVTTNLAGAGAVTQKDPITGNNLALTNFRGLFIVCGRAAAGTAPGVLANTDDKTSTTTVPIGSGSKSFTTTVTGLGYVTGQRVRVVSATGGGANYMEGVVASYNSGTGALVVTVDSFSGSASFSDWTIYALPVAQITSSGFAFYTNIGGGSSGNTPINLYEGSCFALFDGTGTAIAATAGSVERFKHATASGQTLTVSLVGTTGLKVSVFAIGS